MEPAAVTYLILLARGIPACMPFLISHGFSFIFSPCFAFYLVGVDFNVLQ